jgi:Zn-dependent metalloprotease
MRFIFLTMALCANCTLFAQSAKVSPPPKRHIPQEQKTIKTPQLLHQVPTAENPFGVGDVQYKPQAGLAPRSSNGEWLTMLDDSGITTFAATTNPDHQMVLAAESINPDLKPFLANLPLNGIKKPENEFRLVTASTDEQGNQHFRMEQVFEGVPVYGSEIILHTKGAKLQSMNGRYEPTPSVSLQPSVSREQARANVESAFGKSRVRTNWSPEHLRLIGGEPFKAELIVFMQNEKAHLAWQCTLRPNVLNRMEYIVDAHTGAILNTMDRTCRIHAGGHACTEHTAINTTENPRSTETVDGTEMPPVTGSGLDLFDINRTFGAWQEGATVYMMDATKSMFNSGASTFPGKPVGVVATFDALNTSPQNNNFNYVEVKSSSNTFSNKKAAVSAHYNAAKCFDYFKSAFNRNSIDGVGGNIISLVNVVEDDGSTMENAFWNGDAMWYGNGGSLFQPLARGLDVGGHEMTHGVIEKTANLIYQNQSGALNESFADIFGVMIDRDDWKIGEDVVKSGVSPNGCLRSMENPNNNDSQGGNFWQPKHMNQIYTGTQDNGGVHINSGITNHAFFLFATNSAVGKEKAEQVYYKALRDYLTKNSKFIDCRVAVLQAATDLYGAAIATAAGAAFDAVGIFGPGSTGGGGGTGGGTVTAPPGNLNTNPGQDLILVTTEDQQKLQLATNAGTILGDLYTDGLISRPSVTDKGDYVVFVNEAKKIVGIALSYSGGTITPTEEIIGNEPIWRNVAISKDGKYLAAVVDAIEPKITLVNFVSGDQKDFVLYNPTYTNGQVTNNVGYADILEFDYSGKFLMYDAENQLNNQSGQDLTYWDISFLNFTNGTGWTSGTNIISKLFNGLPDNVSVGNPTFSKNSPHIIAFDVIDGNDSTNDIYGANTETGKNGSIVTNNGDLGWPNHNRLDNAIVYETPFFLGGIDIFKKNLGADKISSTGNATSFIESRTRPVWFANGNRSLNVRVFDLPESAEPIAVYPNPTNDGVWFSLEDNDQKVGIELYSIDGRLMYAERQSAAGQVFVPMQKFAEGAYQLRLITAKGVRTARIIKN